MKFKFKKKYEITISLRTPALQLRAQETHKHTRFYSYSLPAVGGRKRRQRGEASRRTFGADEAPADVDVLVVLAAFARREVIGTQEAVVCQHQAAGCHAVVIGVIRHWAANAPSKAAWQGRKIPEESRRPHWHLEFKAGVMGDF